MVFSEVVFTQELKKFHRLLKAQQRRLTRTGVHDLRVCLRRLRSHLSIMDFNSAYHPSDETKKYLKNLSRLLGDRRQWDVTLQEAKKFHLETTKLQSQQKAASSMLRQYLQSPEARVLSEELKRFERRVKGVRIQIRPAQLKFYRRQLKAGLKHRKWSSQQLHEVRISTKKVRYAFECLSLPVKELKALQDHLGKSHDLSVLRECYKHTKVVRKAERLERRKVLRRIRPALRSSLDVLKRLR